MGYIEESGIEDYKPTAFTKCLAHPLIGDGYVAVLPVIQALLSFHEYSRTRGYKNPENAKDTPSQFAHQTDLPFFPYLQSKGYGRYFNNHMGGYKLGCKVWMRDYYPVKERLFQGADMAPEAVFLVDVGGNVGHEMILFQRLFPDHPGKLIAQDLPVVIGQIKEVGEAVEPMAYDMFTEQPVKGWFHEGVEDAFRKKFRLTST